MAASDHDAPPDLLQRSVEQDLQRALAHHQAGQLQAAADLYSAILRAQPAHPHANHNLGVLAIQSGQPAASLPFLKAALEKHPGTAQYWLSYIDALILSQQPDSATAVITQGREYGLHGAVIDALTERAAKTATPMATAIALRAAGRLHDALALTRQWLATHTDDAAGHALLGDLLLSSKQEAVAWDALQTALALNPALAEVQCTLARLRMKQQKISEALAAAQAAHEAAPANPETQTLLATILIASHQPEPAGVLLAAVLQRRPRYADALVSRARLKSRGGDQHGALADIQQALAATPHHTQARRLEVSLHHRLGNTPDLIAALEQYLALEPDDVTCMMPLAELRRLDNRLDEAIALLSRATSLEPANASAWTNLGIVLHQQRRPEPAKLAYVRALELAPDSLIAAHNLGAMALSAGEPEAALRYFKQAIRTAPGQGESHLNLGHALYDANQVKAALAAYHKTCTINASDGSGPRAALYLAILYYLHDDLARCKHSLERARPVSMALGSSDPSDRIYWNYLSTLLAWRQCNPFPVKSSKDAAKLYVIGESHALAAHATPVTHLGRPMRCEAQWIAGVKQWHLGGAGAYRSLSKFKAVLALLPPASSLLLCIGEIDCRHDEGMLIAWKKHPEQPLAALVQNTVDRYLLQLTAARARHGHQLIICGVPATNADIDQLTASERRQFLQLIEDFNLYLRQQALGAGMDFLDLYAMTNRGDGVSNQRWHLDLIHLLPSAMTAAFEHHLCRPAQA